MNSVDKKKDLKIGLIIYNCILYYIFVNSPARINIIPITSYQNIDSFFLRIIESNTPPTPTKKGHPV